MIGNLEYYKVFYYVVKAGSVTLAAEKLSVSQPAVSQAIKQLERQLEVVLFHRGAKGLKLSKEGSLLYSYVEKGYEQIDIGVKKVQQMKKLEVGEIRIGASDMTLRFYLLPFLEQFHEKYPDIKIIVTNAPTPETLAILEEGKIDFGIVSMPFDSSVGLDISEVHPLEDIFVGGRRFISYKNKILDFKNLEEMPTIALEKNTSTRRYMDCFLEQKGVSIQPDIELATSDMIVQFALRNLGIGCVVRDFAQPFIDSGQLFELNFNQIIPKRQMCVVRHRKAPLSAAASQLLTIMEQETAPL